MRTLRPRSKLTQLTQAASLVVMGAAAQAQTPAKPPEPAGGTETVVITGIRQGLETSLNLKRNAQGIVDGIVAEDIGKFPDTNVAESMQRIAGVSIDRSIGEGSKVTVRGVGPDFNLVLLNGRQMPASSIGITSASNSRSFDFANLASEAVAALEVFKTSRADSPTGGIGATINIKTARPLDTRRQVANLGVKLVSDESNKRLPEMSQGAQYTPEISGIYSNVFADGKFGIALTASHQKRSGGYNQAAIDAGWRTFKGDEQNWGTIPLPGQAGSENIKNRPKASDLYVIPQELRYSLNAFERTRTNGQLVLQFRPGNDLTATVDHTYSENKVHTKRHELSAWFNFGPSSSTWTDGPIARPLTYTENYADPADVAMAGSIYGTKNRNQSTGVNVEWKVRSDLKFELDGHHSVATSGADSPYGSNSTLGASMQNRASVTADFSSTFPVTSLTLSGNPADSAKLMQVTGSSFRNSLMRNEVDQAQLKGKWDFGETRTLDFGVGLTKVNNRTSYANNQQNDWGGHNTPAAYDDALWQPAKLQPFFSHSFGGANGSKLFNDFFLWDFQKVRDAAVKADGSDKFFKATDEFTDDRRTQEKTTSAFVQFVQDWNWGMPMTAAIGLRYESTKVESQALVPIITGIQWVAANEFALIQGAPGFTALSGSYSHVLPSIDWEVSPTRDLKLRASLGQTIGRPGWGAIQGGQTLTDFRVDGGSGSQGNPSLKPLKSTNLDLSAEYYYAKSSYAALGLFHKSIKNFIGNSSVKLTPFNLATPIGGPLYNEAVSKSCPTKDASCIRTYILNTYNGTRGVVRTGFDGSGNPLGTITGQTGDPTAGFTISVPVNERSDTIKGIELNVQHAFGKTGFGVAANYTKVRSGLKYDDRNQTDQNALLGVSDSANLVTFYENETYSARLAYNWRGKFLSSLNADVFGSAGPSYTDAYGQWDLSLGYKINKRLSLQFEGINLNDGLQVIRGRAGQTQFLTQTGRRYMIAGRYNF